MCKIGKAIYLDFSNTEGGYFETIYEVPIEQLGMIEILLQNEFRKLNLNVADKTDFYNTKIVPLIEPFLNRFGIQYKNLLN